MSTTTKKKPAKAQSANGSTPTSPLAEAIAKEQVIAHTAKGIRADAVDLTPELFLKLAHLLREPISEGFIVATPAVSGKPYESRGIKSLQVQIDRMDAVLTALHWGWKTEYLQDGKLAHVTIWIGRPDQPLVMRTARGGVDRANTSGNLFKGSETNAAKLAFARIGPGHEVYLGATDLDPDVSADAAKAQDGPAEVEAKKLTAEQVENLAKSVTVAELDDHLPAKLRAFGVSTIAELTYDQALALHAWTTKGGADG